MLLTRCAGCGETGTGLCRRCRFALVSSKPSRADGIVSAAPLSGVTKELIVGLKYRNRRGLAKVLSEQIARQLNSADFDVVTWAPTSGRRATRRGYDQSELMARALAARWRKPCRRLLYRSHGPAQTGRSRAERLDGPVFQPRPMRPGLRVLVIDDVVTTGATLQSAREALLRAGAGLVTLASVAATPDAPVPPWARSQPRDHTRKPANVAIVARAEVLSSSTHTPKMPRAFAASTLAIRSSANAVRPATALSLVKAS